MCGWVQYDAQLYSYANDDELAQALPAGET